MQINLFVTCVLLLCSWVLFDVLIFVAIMWLHHKTFSEQIAMGESDLDKSLLSDHDYTPLRELHSNSGFKPYE